MTIQPIDACDSLYVSTHGDDVPFSCAGRVLSEHEAGLRVTVLTVFGKGARRRGTDEAASPLARLGVRQESLGLPEAASRRAGLTGLAALAGERDPEDEQWVSAAADALADARHRAGAKQVYVPLGVGGHVDHRLTHEASLRSFASGDGRNVFLYEDRPEAFVRGAVRIRLGHLGARLPPGAAEAVDDTSLAAYLLRFHLGPSLRGDLKGWGPQTGGMRAAARHWREARSWRPGKGFGPRLHPILHVSAEASLPTVRTIVAETAASPRAGERMVALAARYARRLGARGHAERLWLLLPHRGDGRLSLAAPEAVDTAVS